MQPRKSNQYPFIVGIGKLQHISLTSTVTYREPDFRSKTCSFSVALKDDPSVYTIDNWYSRKLHCLQMNF